MKTTNENIFGTNLRRARLFLELTKEEASAKCRISLDTWQKMEEGLSEPGITLLLRISKGLGIENLLALISDRTFLNKPGDALAVNKEARIEELERSLLAIVDQASTILGNKPARRRNLSQEAKVVGINPIPYLVPASSPDPLLPIGRRLAEGGL